LDRGSMVVFSLAPPVKRVLLFTASLLLMKIMPF
jgi:hypothetical protein